ncbi:Cyclin-dependent kinases regulatory subunit 1-like protein [Dinothrombium tinctorium]|uniref:Cyclin-dependent kinases regulatory subunit n=1 Tax=Dinothrombium tinctorium TaxID=1965070 RepID=A0A3S3SER3_9ACAR|nr:Cyclin-dependent kinases regulatory subunit 1-like protein [Dinothrombium tinctorium]RWS13163.1 Cyclin-dependent kinases regulatory subunit 1-like protein [Dinothrombium tinctorium]RWS13605.1 Cyclin-dependent kinases regulatory subunit 1-like protein [Dinothrombium tinctorium]
MAHKNIYYSDKYYDEKYEYRHVVLPKDLAKLVPKTHLMTESEWRNLGVQQSHGWIHYMIHEPEPHILLFRRQLHGPAPSQEEQLKAEMSAEQ